MNDQSSNGIQPSPVPIIPPRMGSKTLPGKGRNSLENSAADELSKRHLSLGNAIPDHSITLPVTYYQNIFDFKTDSSKSKRTNLNTPGISSSPSSSKMSEETDFGLNPGMPRCDMPFPPLPGASADDCAQLSVQQSSDKLDRSSMPLPPTPLDAVASSNSEQGSIRQSSDKLDRSSMPLPPTPLDAVVSSTSEQGSIQQSSDKLDRSSMPLPPTPLDAVTSSNSEQGSIRQSSDKLDRSSMPLPPTPLDAVASSNSEQGSIRQSSDKLDRSSMPLPPTPLDAVASSDSKKTLAFATLPVEVEGSTVASEDKNLNNGSTDDTHIEEYSSSSDGYERIDLLDFPEKQWPPLPSTTNDTAATVTVAITTPDGESCITIDTEINDNKQADTDQKVASATNTSTNDLPSSALEVMLASTSINEELLPIADTEASKDHETTICLDEDYVISDYEFYSMQKQQQTSLTTDGTGKPVYLELKCLNPELGNYILMHKVDSPNSRRPFQKYAYDYVYHSYIEMCRRKLRQSGVPPRRVKREGYTPSASVSINTVENYVSYVNITRLHDTTLLPPRGNNDVDIPTVFPEEQSDHHPVMPPRNISRNGCYLSAPSAIPM